jgi:di/tricarboxylate transporter
MCALKYRVRDAGHLSPRRESPNTIIFATNRIKIWEMAKTGIWLNLLAVFLVTLATLIIGKVIFNLNQSPDWM